MNQLQQKYILGRIDDIKIRLIVKAKEKYTQHAVKLTGKQKLALIQDGTVKLDTKKLICKMHHNKYNKDSISFPDTSIIFDFSKFEKKEKVSRALYSTCDKIDTKAAQLKDSLLLGDSEKALKAIGIFARMAI